MALGECPVCFLGFLFVVILEQFYSTLQPSDFSKHSNFVKLIEIVRISQQDADSTKLKCSAMLS